MNNSKVKLVHGAYILARYSTDHQKEDSIEVQVDACRAWCQKIGIMRYGNVVRDDDGHRNSHSHGGDVIEVEGVVPAIVDLKTWERVQTIMNENSRAQAGRPATVRDYPLKGKVFCLECGAAMSVSCSTSHGKKHFYYWCGGRKRRDDCSNSPIRCDTLEHRVAEVVRQILFSPMVHPAGQSPNREGRESGIVLNIILSPDAARAGSSARPVPAQSGSKQL